MCNFSLFKTVMFSFVFISFELRLLHPGANTPDILTQYVSAIKALRLLDPTGVMLEQACQPVKQYLK